MKKIIGNRRRFRQLAWLVSSCLLLWLACEEVPRLTSAFTPAADFEEQESIQMCWNKKHKKTLLALIKTISQNDHVTLFYNENNHRSQNIEAELIIAGANLDHIEMHPFKLKKDNIWIRDYGPSFLKDESGQSVMVGFQYKHLEMEEYTDFTDQLSAKMKIPLYKSRVFSAGGGREINGKGTIILVESYEKEINPGLTLAEIEAEYQQLYNQKKVIWLKKGIPQDDFFGHGPILDNIYPYGVCGHVDEFCRFAGPNTILLTAVDSSDLERDPFYALIHQRLEENYQILAQSTDQDGNPFQIIRVPQAPVLFAKGKLDEQDIIYTPVTSYLNFVLTNKSVIIPAYYKEGDPDYVKEKDQEAVRIFRQAFPTREIHTINALDLNYDGGGLHCVTLPKPGKPLKVKSKRKYGS